MSALDTPEIVYGNTVPEATFPVVNVTTNVTPSSGVVELTPKKYVGSGKLVSAIVILIVASSLSSANTNVSTPSSNNWSAVTCRVTVVFAPTIKVPVKLAPLISALLTPVIVYGIIVLVTRFSVVNVIVTVSPSLTPLAVEVSTYVGVATATESSLETVPAAASTVLLLYFWKANLFSPPNNE